MENQQFQKDKTFPGWYIRGKNITHLVRVRCIIILCTDVIERGNIGWWKSVFEPQTCEYLKAKQDPSLYGTGRLQLSFWAEKQCIKFNQVRNRYNIAAMWSVYTPWCVTDCVVFIKNVYTGDVSRKASWYSRRRKRGLRRFKNCCIYEVLCSIYYFVNCTGKF